ncbi:MAG: DNA replication/repair protein RecF [Ectothiorhodospiraceae bacterium]|nr:DNA replication/repair protein RecF [Ectothiorhodospiraceae bacterium]MCH8504117.1 DNA replication/repair protein RecF [Ectothiorhodospiraceae bacterium]
MALRKLSLYRVRNLVDQAVEFAVGLNLITGPNAAGKTSVLEAIHCLARAASFRTNQFDQVIRHDAGDLIISGELEHAGSLHHIGVQRHPRKTRVRIDGEDARSLSALARHFPIQVINSESQRLLQDGPKVRRAFLNWSVFHVEQDYYQAWRRFDRALRQRNAALRTGDLRLCSAWEPELVSASDAVTEARERFVSQLATQLQARVHHWLPGIALDLRYRRGWTKDRPLAEQLTEARRRERELGHTLYGPHRADLVIRAEGVEAQHWLSRGQQKVLVMALLLAQVERLAGASDWRPLLLVDDIGAELDAGHAEQVMQAIAASPAQTFVTAITRDTVSVEVQRWMQVEGGRLQEMI